MHDIIPEPQSVQINPLDRFRLGRMILSPYQWKSYRQLVRLNWLPVKFDPNYVKQVPDDQIGIYSFVVKPEVADHRDVAYLMYVGKVERQTFRARYRQYLVEFKKGDESRWVHVTEMLNRWQGFLWFYYAAVSKPRTIAAMENDLISAFLPPCNKKFNGDVGRDIKKLFAL